MDVARATLPPALDRELAVSDGGTTEHGELAEDAHLSSSGTEDAPRALEMDNEWRAAGWTPRPKRKRHEHTEGTAVDLRLPATQPRPVKAIPIPGEPNLWFWDEVSADRVSRWIECDLCSFRSSQGLMQFRQGHATCACDSANPTSMTTAAEPDLGSPQPITAKVEIAYAEDPANRSELAYSRVLARSDIVKQSMYVAKELYEMLEPVISKLDGTFPVFVSGGDCWTFQATNHENRGSQHFVPPRRWKPFLLAHQLNIGDALIFRVGVHAASVEIQRRRGGQPAKPLKPMPTKVMDVETAISIAIAQGGLTETDQTVLKAMVSLSEAEDVRVSRLPPTQQFNNLDAPTLIRSSRNISGFQGVTQVGVKWQAQITRLGRASYIGTFDTPEEAAVVYAQATAAWDGAFATKSRVRRGTVNPSHCEVTVDDPQARVVRRLTNADVSGLMFYVNKPLMQIFQGERYKGATGTPDRDTISRFQVVDEDGFKWPLEVKVYSNNHNRYLGREPWKNLISAKHLSVNDTLSFHREDSTVYMQVFRNGAPLPETSKSLSFTHTDMRALDRTVDTRTPSDRLLVPDVALGREAVPIQCVNGVDDAPAPNFVYVSKFVTAEGVHMPRDPGDLGFCCDCVGDCSAENCRCMTAYDNTGCLLPLDHRIEPVSYTHLTLPTKRIV
eukprot:TRINITY_DN49705_c0_g1_i3.p1 TRINITY_DN49705_c0_g1~~TRINITY_DN49705_c0_g1_i3.p1  ORF type:complete len:671 (-),score=57.14 TRINITY_DN49705_c0_g1_i3:115-2127(-)